MGGWRLALGNRETQLASSARGFRYRSLTALRGASSARGFRYRFLTALRSLGGYRDFLKFVAPGLRPAPVVRTVVFP